MISNLKLATKAFELQAQILRSGVTVDYSKHAASLEAQGWEVWYSEMFGAQMIAELADHQREAIEWHWDSRMAQRRGERPEFLAYFEIWARRHAKSTLAKRIAVCDGCLSITSGERGYCLYVGGTKEKTRGHATSIETLLGSAKVKQYYPSLAEAKKNVQGNQKGWTADFIYTAGGYIYHFISLDTGVAGANVDDIRPTLIVPDDIDERNDSLAVSERRFNTLTKAVLLARQANTLVLFAQNLISSHSVMYRIYKGKTRALTNRFPTKPIPAIKGLLTEVQTRNGMPRDVIIAGTPTWEKFNLELCQDEIDTAGLSAFMTECQHEVEGDKRDLVVPEYDEAVHVITWSEFYAKFGKDACGCKDVLSHQGRQCPRPAIPKHWLKYILHDWGSVHRCVTSFLAVSSRNSVMPNHYFLYGGVTVPQATMADDVARQVIKKLNPAIRVSYPELNREDEEDAIYRDVDSWLKRDDSYEMWHMSHEAKTARDIYRQRFGLPFQACNPGADGGVEEMRAAFKVDYKAAHPFRPEAKGASRFWWIVDDDQLETALDDGGLALWREQFPEWKTRQVKLNESGLTDEKPMKVYDDCGNSLMMGFVHFGMFSAADLTAEEKREQKIDEGLRGTNYSQRWESFAPEDRWRVESARAIALAEVKEEEEREEAEHNPYDFERFL